MKEKLKEYEHHVQIYRIITTHTNQKEKYPTTAACPTRGSTVPEFAFSTHSLERLPVMHSMKATAIVPKTNALRRGILSEKAMPRNAPVAEINWLSTFRENCMLVE